LIRDFAPLGEPAQMAAAVAATGETHALAGGGREFAYHVRHDGVVPGRIMFSACYE
jgi:hypothetical protein